MWVGRGRAPTPQRSGLANVVGREPGGLRSQPTFGTYGDPQCLPPLHRHTPPTSSGRAGRVERANGRLGSLFTSGGGIRCIWGLRRRPERLLEPEAFHFLATPAAAEAARERAAPSLPQAAAKLCVRTPGCRRVLL